MISSHNTAHNGRMNSVGDMNSDRISSDAYDDGDKYYVLMLRKKYLKKKILKEFEVNPKDIEFSNYMIFRI